MTSFKGYVNDIENERVNGSILTIDLNRFLGCKNQMFNAWNIFLNERTDSTLTLSFSKSLAYPLNNVMIRHFKALLQSEITQEWFKRS